MADRERSSRRDDDDDRGSRRNRDDDERPSRRSRDDDDRGSRRGGSSGFRYRARSAEDVQQRASRNTSGVDTYLNDALTMFKAGDGDNTVRILPGTWDDPVHYGIDVFLHYDIGPDNAAYLCLEKMKGKPCPVCEARKRAVADGDQEYADKLRPSSRVLMYVLDRAKERDGIKVWSMSSRQDSDIARLAVDKTTGEALNVDSPEDGYDLTFTREGQGMKTRYSGFAFARRSSDLDNDKALDFAVQHPLPEQLVFYSYDHIKNAFGGGSRPAPKDDDERPSRRSRDDDAPRGRSKDDDDEPAPRRRGRDDDEKPARREAPKVELTWDEVHEMSFRKLSNLIEEHDLDVDSEATRDDEELADQVCEALDIKKAAPSRRSRDDDDEPAPRRRTRVEADDDAPRRRDKDDDEPPSRQRLREQRDRG